MKSGVNGQLQTMPASRFEGESFAGTTSSRRFLNAAAQVGLPRQRARDGDTLVAEAFERHEQRAD
jgi:hypothetical protein